MLDKYCTPIENNVYDLSKAFAIRVVKLFNYLVDSKKEYVMSKQLLRAGTSIGANVFEGKNAQSRADFTNKMNIALKEASESGFWIDLLHDTQYISDKEYESVFADCKRLIAVLTKIVKATKPQQ
jgi:four helix bundle protein